MGKADKYVKRFQEKQQRANIFKPWKNKVLNGFISFSDLSRDIDGQDKLANDLMKSKR